MIHALPVFVSTCIARRQQSKQCETNVFFPAKYACRCLRPDDCKGAGTLHSRMIFSRKLRIRTVRIYVVSFDTRSRIQWFLQFALLFPLLPVCGCLVAKGQST